MVLSTELFNYWEDLLYIISEGQFVCSYTADGHCVINKGCGSIANDVLGYTFRFNVADQYNVTFPLSTFAVDKD